MQTRRLRLGDVVDDYCPRERRLSNHVVVAMVDDTIKQTRCTTCDFEHPYKDGKLPARRKKKDATAVLYQQVLEGMTEKPPSAPLLVEDPPVDRPVVEPQARGEVLAMAAGSSTPVTVTAPPSAPASASSRPSAANLRTRTSKAKAAAAAAAAAPAPPAEPVAAPSAPPVASAPAPPPTRIAPPSGEPPRLAASPASATLVERAQAHTARGERALRAEHARHLPPGEVPAAPADHAKHAALAQHTDPQDDDDAIEPAAGEAEPLHRRTLIRAQLPRPVGDVPTRQAPTFTIREAARAPKFRRPFARNARPQGSGQNGMGNGPMGRAAGARNGQQPRGKKGGASQQGAHRFGQGQSHGQGQSGHHAKGRQGNQGNKRFK
jgi:hypothetical protein